MVIASCGWLSIEPFPITCWCNILKINHDAASGGVAGRSGQATHSHLDDIVSIFEIQDTLKG